MGIAVNMLYLIVISLLAATVSSTDEQPPGCPFPSGPYVPPKCGKNEYFEVCSFKCPPQTCESLWSKLPCDSGDGCCRNECRCIDGHLRNEDGECVPTQDCYQSNSQSSASAASSSSASGGQASSSAYAQAESSSSSGDQSNSQSSASAASSSSASGDQASSSANAQAESSSSSGGACKPKKPSCIPTCAEPNPKNCEVDPKYICKGGSIFSKKGGKCIRIEDCPQNLGCNGDIHAVIKSCPPPCPSTCDNPTANQIPCSRACLAFGCACKPGYILSDKGCVKPECCPSACKPKKPSCIPTCAEPNPKNCEVDPKYICDHGSILSKKGGKCIKTEDCPQNLGCNGDKYAVIMSCPPPCPSTCDSPNQTPCKRACLAVGCACKPGYILSDKGCVKPDCCPNGYPCSKNETFVNCKVNCPTNYCAVDDSPGYIICDPVYPCPSGCVCKFNYKRKSVDDPRCILAEECPPVECTRQYEEWSSCPSACLAEDCNDVDNQPITCNTLVHNCEPRCICKKGYFRNEDKLCIPAEDCPKYAPQ